MLSFPNDFNAVSWLSQIAATRYNLNDDFFRAACDLYFKGNRGYNPCAAKARSG
jgi:hypothetical protein